MSNAVPMQVPSPDHQDDDSASGHSNDNAMPIVFVRVGSSIIQTPVPQEPITDYKILHLTDNLSLCHVTHFGLSLNGQVLDEWTEARSIEAIQPGIALDVVPKMYEERSAMQHAARLLDLMSLDINSLSLTDTAVQDADQDLLKYKIPERLPEDASSSFPNFSVGMTSHNSVFDDIDYALDPDFEGVTPEEAKAVADSHRSVYAPMPSFQVPSSDKKNTKKNKSKKPNHAAVSSSSKADDKEVEQENEKKEASENASIDDFELAGAEPASVKGYLRLLESQTAPLIRCVRSLHLSGWNPVPSNRRLAGDFFYLEVKTMENRHLTITACKKGFFVNNSDSSNGYFDPSPSSIVASTPFYTLAGLLSAVSPQFKRFFPLLLSQRCRRHPFETLPSPAVFPRNWLAPAPSPSYSLHKSDADHSSLISANLDDRHSRMGQFNEEFQNAVDAPTNTDEEVTLKERILQKLHVDFVEAATKAAKFVVLRKLQPINPFEQEDDHVFLHNGILLSKAASNKRVYKEVAGEDGKYNRKVYRLELKGIARFLDAGVEGAHVFPTAVVDYRGHRILAQAPFEGLFTRMDKMASLHSNQRMYSVWQHVVRCLPTFDHRILALFFLQAVHGADDGESQSPQAAVEGSIEEPAHDSQRPGIFWDAEFHEMMAKSASSLQMAQRTYADPKTGKEHSIVGSPFIKAFKGGDDRYYLTDLMRCTPRDTNFLDLPYAVFRQELLAHFENRHRYAHMQRRLTELRAVKQQEKKEKEEKLAEDGSVEKVEEQGPQEDEKINPLEGYVPLSYNLSLFCNAKEKFVPSSPEQLKQDEENIRALGTYVLAEALPRLAAELFRSSSLDGEQLTASLHEAGVNMRYLGHLAKILDEKQAPLSVRTVVLTEMVIRAAKQELNRLLERASEDDDIPSLISSFFNSLVSTSLCDLHLIILAYIKDHFQYELSSTFITSIPISAAAAPPQEAAQEPVLSLPRWVVLRGVCRAVGIRLLARDYEFSASSLASASSASASVFLPSDVLDFFPVVRHEAPRSFAKILLEKSVELLSNGDLESALNLASQAHNMIQSSSQYFCESNIFACAQISAMLFEIREFDASFLYAHKSYLIAKRVFGVCSFQAFTQLSSLVFLLDARGKSEESAKWRARLLYLSSLLSGVDNQDLAVHTSAMANYFLSTGRDFSRAYKLFRTTLKFAERTMRNTPLHADALQALAQLHAVQAMQSSNPQSELHKAIFLQKQASSLFEATSGKDSESAKQSLQLLEDLVATAVHSSRAAAAAVQTQQDQLSKLAAIAQAKGKSKGQAPKSSKPRR